MRPAPAHLPATLWMVDDIPSRMVFAGRRWKVTDTPTRLGDSARPVASASQRGSHGWRFQGTDDEGRSMVFDVFEGADGWHVYHSYG